MEQSEGLKTQRINIFLSESLHQRLSGAAIKRNISKSAYIRFALENALQSENEIALQQAVKELAPLYKTDQELTIFTSLDGEDFK